jgi:hypothetical protein
VISRYHGRSSEDIQTVDCYRLEYKDVLPYIPINPLDQLISPPLHLRKGGFSRMQGNQGIDSLQTSHYIIPVKLPYVDEIKLQLFSMKPRRDPLPGVEEDTVVYIR